MLTLSEVEALARAAHEGQTDKAGRPYAEHLRAVAEGVRSRGGDDEQIAAAWLHDAVEDDALTEAWLREAAPGGSCWRSPSGRGSRRGRTRRASSPPPAPCW